MRKLLLALLFVASPLAGQVDVVFPGYRVYVADSDSTISTHQTYHVALENAVNWAVQNNRATRIDLVGPVRVSVEPWQEVSDTVWLPADTVRLPCECGEDPGEDPEPGDEEPGEDPEQPEDPGPDPFPEDSAVVVVPPSSGVWLIQDWNFSSTAQMQSTPGMEGAGNAGGLGESRPVVLSQPGPWGGIHALENYFGTIPADWQPQVATNWYFPATERELWIETWIRFAPEWEIGPGNPLYTGGNVDHKTIFIWEQGWRRWEVKFGPNWNDCVASAATHDIFYGYLTFPDSRGRCQANRDVWDGQWHRFRLHVRMGSGDGRMRVWWDDSLVIDRQNLNTQSGTNRFMGITFGGNRNQGTNHPMSFFYGPARLYRADPGW